MSNGPMVFSTMHMADIIEGKSQLSRGPADDTLNLLLRLFQLPVNKCAQDVSLDLDLIELGRRDRALAEDRCQSDKKIYRSIISRAPVSTNGHLPFGLLLNIRFAVVYDFLHNTDVLVRGLAERSRERQRFLVDVITGITGSSQEFLCKGIEFRNAAGLRFFSRVGWQVGT
jgi:hypothetical protein